MYGVNHCPLHPPLARRVSKRGRPPFLPRLSELSGGLAASNLTDTKQSGATCSERLIGYAFLRWAAFTANPVGDIRCRGYRRGPGSANPVRSWHQ